MWEGGEAGHLLGSVEEAVGQEHNMGDTANPIVDTRLSVKMFVRPSGSDQPTRILNQGLLSDTRVTALVLT